MGKKHETVNKNTILKKSCQIDSGQVFQSKSSWPNLAGLRQSRPRKSQLRKMFKNQVQPKKWLEKWQNPRTKKCRLKRLLQKNHRKKLLLQNEVKKNLKLPRRSLHQLEPLPNLLPVHWTLQGHPDVQEKF